MVVNDNAGELDERGVLESIASRLAPAVFRACVKTPSPPFGPFSQTRPRALQ